VRIVGLAADQALAVLFCRSGWTQGSPSDREPDLTLTQPHLQVITPAFLPFGA
jgi:hypothetical protein